MSIDRDHFPINVTGDTEGSPAPPMYADPNSRPEYPYLTDHNPIAPSTEQPQAPLYYYEQPTIQEAPHYPWYKRRGVQLVGVAGLGLSVAMGGTAYAINHHSSPTETSVSTNETADGTDGNFPLDVITSGRDFSELPAAEQADLERLHGLTYEQFSALPLEQQYRYGKYIVDKYKAPVINYSGLRSGFTNIPKLVDYGPATPGDTAQQVEAQRAIKVAVASRLMRDVGGVPTPDYNEVLKLAPYINSAETPNFAEYIQSVRDEQAQGLQTDNLTPCSILESQKTGNTVSYICEMQYTDKSGFTYAKRVAQWRPFTTYEGKLGGTWVLTTNYGYKSQPHL